MTFLFGMPGPVELVVIGMIGLLLFGKRLPSIARSMGKSFNSFKAGLKDGKRELAELDEEIKSIAEKTEEELKL